MCPNCLLNQAGLQPGVYVAYGVCALFFLIAMVALFWAFRNGEFDDMEGSKFDMMDDGDESVSAAARKRVDIARANAASAE